MRKLIRADMVEARRLWSVFKFDTHQISLRLRVPEAAVWNSMDAIMALPKPVWPWRKAG